MSDEIKVVKSERPTIMSGKVITFATNFKQVEGLMGPRDEPEGPFEVSVSRDALMVHRAECSTPEQVGVLIEAIRLAGAEFPRLRSRNNGY